MSAVGCEVDFIASDSVTFDIVVAVDSSTDLTWEIAMREVKGLGVVVCTNAGAVGEARALTRPYARCWLANTDADSVVPPHWLKGQIELAANGIDAIAGTIDVDNYDEHHPIVQRRFREPYPIAPDGSHPHVHGANLGIRANVYLQAGGWRDLRTGEDHDLWTRVSKLGVKKLSVNHFRVLTSGRRIGRAPHGFAEALAAHNENVA